MNVPFFDMTTELAPIRPEIDAAIARVLDSGTFIGGPEVTAFEQELAAYTGARHAIGVSSGSDALHACGMALGLRPGDEVVTTPFTFVATAAAFARLGARIVFADIDERTLCLDPRAALAACTPRTRAIVTVDLFGRRAAFPDAAPCPVIEDAAQSIGAGPPRGRAAIVSFFPTKNLSALGDGGAVLTNDEAFAARITLLRSQGAPVKHRHVTVGGNFRLDALQAAVLRVKLPHLRTGIAARRARAIRYHELCAGARLPPEIMLPPVDGSHVFNQFVIRAPRRDALRAHLADAGVGSEVYYPVPLHLQECFGELGYRPGAFPKAERAAGEVLALPIQPGLTLEAQVRVVDELARFYR